MRMKYLTFPWWNKTSALAGQLSSSHWQKATGDEEEDVQISDHRSSADFVKFEWIFKEKW